jgi:hypothetical protein
VGGDGKNNGSSLLISVTIVTKNMNIVAFHDALSLCMQVCVRMGMGKKTHVSVMKWAINQPMPTLEHKILRIGMVASKKQGIFY